MFIYFTLVLQCVKSRSSLGIWFLDQHCKGANKYWILSRYFGTLFVVSKRTVAAAVGQTWQIFSATESDDLDCCMFPRVTISPRQLSLSRPASFRQTHNAAAVRAYYVSNTWVMPSKKLVSTLYSLADVIHCFRSTGVEHVASFAAFGGNYARCWRHICLIDWNCGTNLCFVLVVVCKCYCLLTYLKK